MKPRAITLAETKDLRDLSNAKVRDGGIYLYIYIFYDYILRDLAFLRK